MGSSLKAKIKFTDFDSDPTSPESYTCPTEGEIELELDETYWRNEFAKAALLGIMKDVRPIGAWNMPGGVQDAFRIADAMVEEMRKRDGSMD